MLSQCQWCAAGAAADRRVRASLSTPRSRSSVCCVPQVYRGDYNTDLMQRFFGGRDAPYWRRLAPAAVDNYYIRLLLGEGTFYLPHGSVNATHLAAARLILLQYDVVVLLEVKVSLLVCNWRRELACMHMGDGWGRSRSTPCIACPPTLAAVGGSTVDHGRQFALAKHPALKVCMWHPHPSIPLHAPATAIYNSFS